MIRSFLFCAVILLTSLTSCTRHVSNDNLLIAVSIPPQAWFVSQIAGNKADALILVPAGQNPHNYEPTPRQIQALSKASAWILSGTEFEISLRPKIEALFPKLMIVDGTSGVEFRYLTEHEHHDCDDHDHAHTKILTQTNANTNTNTHASHSLLEIDRHTWLGPVPAIMLAKNILNTLCLLDKTNEEYYTVRFTDLNTDINKVFDELKNDLAYLEGKSVFVYHPSFGYFLDVFGIIQEAVETGGKEPTARQLHDLMEKINQEKPAAIFVQAQFPVNAAKTIAASAGAKVIELDPLAFDWLENIKHMGQMLQNIIQ